MEHGIYFDVTKCCGCYACTIACMDQNDIEIEQESTGTNAFRRVFKNEKGVYPETSIQFISLSCMHCVDSPCIMACPTGAIRKDLESGAVLVKQELCIGCHSCSIACTFGIPRFGADGKMQKCGMCLERVKHGLEPACVRTCPSQALTFGSINELSDQKEGAIARKIVSRGLI